MAEITPDSGGKQKGKRKRKIYATRVDLTPMVDLGFLLITFFILTTSWSEPKTMRLILPAEGAGTTVGESASLTLIPGGSNRIFYYHGQPEKALAAHAFGFTGYELRTGLGQLIRNKQRQMELHKTGSSKELMLIIAPTSHASYQNLVDVMDEVAINDVHCYAVVDELKQGPHLFREEGLLQNDF